MLDITLMAPEDSGVASSATIKADLMAAMDKASSDSTITLDISKTMRADSSLAQLIVAFRAEALARGYTAMIKSPDAYQAMLTMLCCDSFEKADFEQAPKKSLKPEAGRER